MSQIYMQRFEYRGAVDKALFDATWGVANDTKARTGNYGGIESGIKHLHSYGTGWGGYVLLEVEDPKALEEYQRFHINNYSHIVDITFEPLVNMDG